MTYSFDQMTERREHNSLKWDVGTDELPMWVADMDFETAPEIVTALYERVNHKIFGYETIDEAYKRSIQEWWMKRHQYRMDEQWMLFCTGVVPAISSIIRKVTAIGERVLVQAPVYNIFYNSIRNNGRELISSDLVYDGKAYTIDFDDLEQKLEDPQTSLMILCNPHNPTGTIWTREALERIGELCAAHHVWVIADEIHCDLVTPGHSYIPFASVSAINAYISMTCIAPTKAFNLAGLQTSCIVVPNPVLRHKVHRAINTDEVAEPNSFALTASIAAFTKGEPWLQEACAYIEQNRQLARSYLEEQLPQLSLVSAHATYLLWIDCGRLHMHSDVLTEHIRHTTGLIVSSGAIYGANGSSFIRMNIACPKERLMDGLTRLYTAVSSLTEA